MIDSQIFVWGIKGVASAGQEHRIDPAKRFIKFLEDEKSKLLLPAPQLAELLSFVPPEQHHSIKRFIDKRFQVRPFDDLAVEKCAELLYNSFNEPDLIAYREEHKVPKQKIKFDCMLVAMAITNRVSKIYSDDKDLKKYAGNQIEVVKMPDIAPAMQQQTLNFELLPRSVKSLEELDPMPPLDEDDEQELGRSVPLRSLRPTHPKTNRRGPEAAQA